LVTSYQATQSHNFGNHLSDYTKS